MSKQRKQKGGENKQCPRLDTVAEQIEYLLGPILRSEPGVEPKDLWLIRHLADAARLFADAIFFVIPYAPALDETDSSGKTVKAGYRTLFEQRCPFVDSVRVSMIAGLVHRLVSSPMGPRSAEGFCALSIGMRSAIDSHLAEIAVEEYLRLRRAALLRRASA